MRSEISSIGEVGFWVEAGCCVFSCRGCNTRDCLLLRLSSSPLRGCCWFQLRFLGLAVSLVAATEGFEGAFVV